jgi:hypothetical protein
MNKPTNFTIYIEEDELLDKFPSIYTRERTIDLVSIRIQGFPRNAMFDERHLYNR